MSSLWMITPASLFWSHPKERLHFTTTSFMAEKPHPVSVMIKPHLRQRIVLILSGQSYA